MLALGWTFLALFILTISIMVVQYLTDCQFALSLTAVHAALLFLEANELSAKSPCLTLPEILG